MSKNDKAAIPLVNILEEITRAKYYALKKGGNKMATAAQRLKDISAGYRYYVVGNGRDISRHKTYKAALAAARKNSFYGVREIQK